MMQTRFDGSDGVHVGQLLLHRPLPDAPAERVVVIQEAIGDCQVPNIATGILARAMGLGLLGPPVEHVFGLPAVAAPTTTPSMLQLALPDRLASYTPPDQNVLPERDNGAHSTSVGTPPAVAQVISLLTTGTIENPCTAPCDPD
jgi:hypothetical protein